MARADGDIGPWAQLVTCSGRNWFALLPRFGAFRRGHQCLSRLLETPSLDIALMSCNVLRQLERLARLTLQKRTSPMAFHIANAVTDAKVRRLSTALGLGLVETIDVAVDEALERRNLPVEEPQPSGQGTAEELEAIIRRDLVTFRRLREEVFKRPSSVGYVPKMIAQYGIVKLSKGWLSKAPTVCDS